MDCNYSSDSFFIAGLSLPGYLTIKTVKRIIDDGEIKIILDQDFDWLGVSKKLLVLATCFNLLSITIIPYAFVKVKSWIDEKMMDRGGGGASQMAFS